MSTLVAYLLVQWLFSIGRKFYCSGPCCVPPKLSFHRLQVPVPGRNECPWLCLVGDAPNKQKPEDIQLNDPFRYRKKKSVALQLLLQQNILGCVFTVTSCPTDMLDLEKEQIDVG